MPGYPIPPWLQPADTTAAFTQGLHLGVTTATQRAQMALQAQEAAMRQQTEMTIQQAQEQFQQQQMARKEQESAQEQARWQAEFGLQASAAAQKHEAMQEYQRRVANHEDPMKVLMDVAPRMGASGSEIAAVIRANEPIPAAKLITDVPTGLQTWQAGRIISPVRPKPTFHTEHRQDAQGNGYDVQVNDETGQEIASPGARGQMTAYQREQERDRLVKLRMDIATLQPNYADPSQVQNAGRRKTAEAAAEQIKRIDDALKALQTGQNSAQSGGPATGVTPQPGGTGVRYSYDPASGTFKPAGAGPESQPTMPPPNPKDMGLDAIEGFQMAPLPAQ